jgi:hypothetical protein
MTAGSLNAAFDDVLVIAGITWLIARQFSWRDVRGLVQLPVLLLVGGGLLVTSDVVRGERVPASGVALLVGELLLVGATGSVMGTRYQFRVTGTGMQCRLDRAGLLLWAAFLLIRLVSLILAARVGAGLLETTGVVLVSFATNRLVASVVVMRRAQRRLSVLSVR